MMKKIFKRFVSWYSHPELDGDWDTFYVEIVMLRGFLPLLVSYYVVIFGWEIAGIIPIVAGTVLVLLGTLATILCCIPIWVASCINLCK